MADRIDAAGDIPIQSALSYDMRTFTLMAWVYLESDRNATGLVFQADDAGANYHQVLVGGDGTTLAVTGSGALTGTATGTSLPTGAWRHVALVCQSGSPNTIKVYLEGSLDISVTDTVTAHTLTRAFFGSDGANWIDARVAYARLWNVALTAGEVATERAAGWAVKTSGLLADWRMVQGARTTDSSGNGKTLTEFGTITDVAGPTLAYVTTISGAMTPAGAAVKRIGKVLAGAITSAGAIVKRTAKTLSGGSTPASALAKRIAQAQSGALTSNGALVRRAGKVAAGTVTSAGSMLRAVGMYWGGTITPAGTIAKALTQRLSGTLTSSGLAIKRMSTALAGSLASAGSLQRQTGKALAGGITPAGAMGRAVSALLSGTLTPAGSLAKRIALAVFNGVLGAVGRLTQRLWNQWSAVTTLRSAWTAETTLRYRWRAETSLRTSWRMETTISSAWTAQSEEEEA